MIKIGITGQNGFIGKYLKNSLLLQKEDFEIIPFKNSYFESPSDLDYFTSNCQVIVHLAALNRHSDSDVIYNTNINLVSKLIDSLERTKSTAHVLISSSTQEEINNLYGKSKKEGRKMLEEWASNSKGKLTGLIIPNVFGPFGKPNYNSVIATFCYKLTHNEIPTIINDNKISIIYIGELVDKIIEIILNNNEKINKIEINPTNNIKVSSVLELLNIYKLSYFDFCQIPNLNSKFEVNLFNTFRSFIDYETFFPKNFKLNTDDRGTFVEIIRLGIGGQVSFSTTVPGITRGNHFHTRKIERFAVIKGEAIIQLRKIGSNEILNFELNGNQPAFVDMPIWYTHNITNIGKDELLTIFWINELFDQNDTDTYFENV
jgi:UDP-2-acetamido-2,6-beta-L-arabino-hexul-4-ose reductase